MTGSTFVDAVPISRIFLSLDNPRHPTQKTEAQAIALLCEKEDVYPLARDIARHGVSPLERFALVPVEKRSGSSAATSYYVTEGNRRICALKLLSDQDLAPARLRKNFEKLAETWKPITTIAAAVFPAPDDVRTWLDRIHSGPQGGIGRRSWDAEQKQRFYGDSKNKSALALLDYAEAENLISKEEREWKLTTTQRFISNSVFREMLGLDVSNQEDFGRTRPKAEFDALVRRFVRDLVGGVAVNSRMNKADIEKYARPLAALPGVTSTRIESESLNANDAGGKGRGRRKPTKPEKAKQ